MSLHTPVTVVDSSAASTVALNAFDYLATRVQSDLLRCNPNIDSTLSAGDKKASLEEKVIAKQSNLGRDIKSGFQSRYGKRAPKRSPDEEHDKDSSLRKSRRLLESVSASKSKSPLVAECAFAVTPMNVTFTEESLAPPHCAIRPSIRSTSYTRLSSNLIVRLNNDDEFILVVPSISNDTLTDSLSAPGEKSHPVT
jgi:hypothetical protein